MHAALRSGALVAAPVGTNPPAVQVLLKPHKSPAFSAVVCSSGIQQRRCCQGAQVCEWQQKMRNAHVNSGGSERRRRRRSSCADAATGCATLRVKHGATGVGAACCALVMRDVCRCGTSMPAAAPRIPQQQQRRKHGSCNNDALQTCQGMTMHADKRLLGGCTSFCAQACTEQPRKRPGACGALLRRSQCQCSQCPMPLPRAANEL